MKEILSIGIPTYNRASQLRNQLQSLFKQDLSLIKEIIVVDNHSDYDIKTLIKEFNSEKIRLIINPFNVMMSTNMVNPFLYCKTEWLWLLSDDDEVEEDAIDKIKKEIENVSTDVGMIKFARTNSPQKEFTTNNLESFIDYYYNEKVIRSGDLVFISTNVYNIAKISNYLGYAFEYAYTYVPYIIPIIKGLEGRNVSIKFSENSIVKYLPPREGNYSFATVGMGLSILAHIPLNVSKEYTRKFLNIAMSINYPAMISWSLKHDSVKELEIIYNNIYRYYIPLKGKLVVKLFFYVMSNNITKRIVLKIYSKIKTRRQNFLLKTKIYNNN